MHPCRKHTDTQAQKHTHTHTHMLNRTNTVAHRLHTLTNVPMHTQTNTNTYCSWPPFGTSVCSWSIRNPPTNSAFSFHPSVCLCVLPPPPPPPPPPSLSVFSSTGTIHSHEGPLHEERPGLCASVLHNSTVYIQWPAGPQRTDLTSQRHRRRKDTHAHARTHTHTHTHRHRDARKHASYLMYRLQKATGWIRLRNKCSCQFELNVWVSVKRNNLRLMCGCIPTPHIHFWMYRVDNTHWWLLP